MRVPNARLAAALGAAALACAAPASALAAGPACVAMPSDKVALQIYSVFEAMTGPPAPRVPGQPFPTPKASPEQLGRFFGDLKAMGWRRFENFAGSWGLAPEAYTRVVKAGGL